MPDMTITVKTPQYLKYFRPQPIKHVYEQHISAWNVSQTKPIIFAVTERNQTIFLIRLSLEWNEEKPYIGMWLSQ